MNILTLGFSGGSDGNLPAMQEIQQLRLNPWVGKIPGEGNGNPLQFLVWRIPWTEKSGRLQSMGSQTVRHD